MTTAFVHQSTDHSQQHSTLNSFLDHCSEVSGHLLTEILCCNEEANESSPQGLESSRNSNDDLNSRDEGRQITKLDPLLEDDFSFLTCHIFRTNNDENVNEDDGDDCMENSFETIDVNEPEDECLLNNVSINNNASPTTYTPGTTVDGKETHPPKAAPLPIHSLWKPFEKDYDYSHDYEYDFEYEFDSDNLPLEEKPMRPFVIETRDWAMERSTCSDNSSCSRRESRDDLNGPHGVESVVEQAKNDPMIATNASQIQRFLQRYYYHEKLPELEKTNQTENLPTTTSSLESNHLNETDKQGLGPSIIDNKIIFTWESDQRKTNPTCSNSSFYQRRRDSSFTSLRTLSTHSSSSCSSQNDDFVVHPKDSITPALPSSSSVPSSLILYQPTQPRRQQLKFPCGKTFSRSTVTTISMSSSSLTDNMSDDDEDENDDDDDDDDDNYSEEGSFNCVQSTKQGTAEQQAKRLEESKQKRGQVNHSLPFTIHLSQKLGSSSDVDLY